VNKILRKILLPLCAASALTAMSSVASTVTLQMNHQMPSSAVGSQVDQWFADEVEKRTDGEVKLRIFWSEGLGAAKETLSLLNNNAIQMAGLSPGYFPAELPLFTAPNSFPMAINNICEAHELMDRLTDEVPGFMEEANANGIRPLFFHVLNPYLLVSVEPITSIEDMQGVKMRTWGSHMPRMVEAVGGTPLTLSLPEIYEGISRGVIDAAPFALDLVLTYKIHEVAKHVSEITLWDGPTWGVWITEDAWSNLSDEHQRIVTEVADEAKQRDLEAVGKAAVAARETLAAEGVTFHEFPESEKQDWKAKLPDFFGEWIKEMEANGKGADARQAISIWKEVVGSTDC